MISITSSATIPDCEGTEVDLSVSGGSPGSGAYWVWYSGSRGETYIGTGQAITVALLSATTYFVRAEGTCDNAACASLTVEVFQLSTGPTGINATTTSVCPGYTDATLTVTGGSLGYGASWVWYRGSIGGTVEGTGSSVTVSPSSPTTYFVRAEGKRGFFVSNKRIQE